MLLDFLGGFGLGLLKVVATILPLGLGFWVGHLLAKRGVRNWLCWVGGIAALLVGYAVFYPAAEALNAASCRGSDEYQACIEGDTEPLDWG